MAPLNPSRNEQRLQAAIDCGKKALRLLQARSAILPDLLAELQRHTRQHLPSLPAATIAVKSQVLDALGTEIWNASTSSLHDDGDDDLPRDPRLQPAHAARVNVALRMFAMVLLDASHQASARRSKDRGQQVRLFKLTLRAARLCLDQDEVELAITALERCSHYLPAAPETPDLMEISTADSVGVDKHEADLKVLEREYYLLRILHAWKIERLDLADHFYHSTTKVKIPACPESQVLYVKIADLCFEIAKAQSRAKETAAAVKWSERGLAILDSGEREDFGQEVVELRLSIAVLLVDQLLDADQEAQHARARDVVDGLEKCHELGNRIALPILRFRVLAHEMHADHEQISQTLQRLIQLAVLTEDNFKIIMQTVRKAEHVVSEPALAALKKFICDRLLPEVRAAHAREPQVLEWLEKATITYILIATSGHNFSSGGRPEELKEFLDKIKQANNAGLSTRATHAAQTLLWKATGAHDDTTPLACCRLLQHPVFEHAGHINKARIGRRLMRVALKQNALETAREAYFNMPGSAQNDPATAYLAFKIALLSEDQELATDSLRTIVKQGHRDPAYLYAAVLDAQQSQMKFIALASLKAVIEQRPPGVQLATLFRCTARLLIAETELPSKDTNAIGQEVVSIFEMAAKSIDDIRRLPEDQKHSELLWWSKNSYNLALRFCPHAELTRRMMSVCLSFLDQIPQDAGLMHEIELTKRKMLCLFLSTTALVILGRPESQSEEYTLQCFLKAREIIATFKACAASLSLEDQDETTKSHTFTMLKYDLEAILKLHRWDDLPIALQACIEAPNTGRWDTLADLVIIVHQHLDASSGSSISPQTSELLVQLLQKIINETWKLDKNIQKVSRWLRFTFTLTLNNSNSRPGSSSDPFALKLLMQAEKMAQKGYHGKAPEYPDAELRWLASMGFNHALDIISQGGEEKGGFEQAEKWLDASLEIARWVRDEGQLHKVLTERREKVRERIAGAGI